jgi:hypothetical protein
MPDDKKKKRSEDETQEILTLAKKRFKASVTAWTDNYTNGLKKLRFFHGDQYDTKTRQERENADRPCLTLNEQPKFALQVCGELRKNKVHIKCSPVDDNGSQQAANVRAGIIKNIEYVSNADSICDHANKTMVISGFGAARVLNRYSNDPKNPFREELYIEKIDNPFAVHYDASAKDQFFSDAEYCFIDTPMNREDFKDTYGEENFPPSNPVGADGSQDELWWDTEKVLIREYFFKEYTVKTMCQLSDGTVKEKDDAEKYINQLQTTLSASKADQDARRKTANDSGLEYLEQSVDDSAIPTISKEREVEEPHIIWMKITADKILEENTWPGHLIPVPFLTGEYLNIGGKKYYYGMFENAEDAQKMVNHAYTILWEIISLMPKTPIMASAEMIEGYDEDYLAANKENFAVLKYRHDENFPNQKPERMQPGQMPQAAFGMFQECKSDMKDMIGMYNADLGDKGPETSGIAIQQRQIPGDTAMYTYPDNAIAFRAHIGKILNAAMSHYYDTERVVRTRGLDGKDAFQPINTTAGNAMKFLQQNPQRYSGMDKKPLKMALKGPEGSATPFNNITEGVYDVVISTGPAYETQRQQTADSILKIAQMSGKINPADLWHIVNAMADTPGLEAWLKTIAKRVPPGMLEPKEGEPPQQPLPPSPQVQVLMGKVQLEQAKIQVEKMKLQVQALTLRNKLTESTDGINTAIISKLDELFNEHHPADLAPGMQPQEGQEMVNAG